ncbi:XRE family transcriptional regulator [Pseudoroseicyclus aestuarii]|uniref:Cro/C1-type helix-turn-helix DNA-binding protein n=1 Tax=Pseudoroseicyclus aestuarii TaxID=1795041 RepID=A0A318SSV5_9RHOB|nr:XRE family transcriptional regulator [Pseudoroseicyclus aestuarii]PYE82372.1 hypothetical protein DFP88_104128 [Pseudoroseicyclus aestuarii]
MPTRHEKQEIFSKNLRSLCAEQRSVSAICREIGLNRQQMERYLKGAAMPSAHNMRRLCLFFDLPEAALLGDPARLRQRRRSEAPLQVLPLIEALRPQPGELPLLRRYIGHHHYFFLTPTWPGQVQCGLMEFYQQGDHVLSRYLGRVRDPDFDKTVRSRFEGQVVLRGDRIFVIEKVRGVVDSFGQTILYAAHQHQGNYLTGMTFGIGWHPHRAPFASQVITRRVPEATPLRQAVQGCGLYAADSLKLDPIVRSYFATRSEPFGVGG